MSALTDVKHWRNAGNEQNCHVRQEVSFEQPVSVSMAPACFHRLTRTEQLFLERGEQGISAIPVVFWMLLWWLEVWKCVLVCKLCVYVHNKPGLLLALLPCCQWECTVCTYRPVEGLCLHLRAYISIMCIYSKCILCLFLLMITCVCVFEFPCSFLSP